jgi:hypothetical protein
VTLPLRRASARPGPIIDAGDGLTGPRGNSN